MKRKLKKLFAVLGVLKQTIGDPLGFTKEEVNMLYEAAEKIAAVGIAASFRFGEAEENEDD